MEKDIIFALTFAVLIAMGFVFAPIVYNPPVVVSHIVIVLAVGMASFGTILGVFVLYNTDKLFNG